jgi:hypothetical protein
MIRIRKPVRAPEILRTRGKNETILLREAFDREPAEYRSGQKTFDFDSEIYGAPAVKSGLPGSEEGQATIDALGLQREELAAQRRGHLATLHLFREALRLLRQREQDGSLSTQEQSLLGRLEAQMQDLSRDEAPYAAVTRAFFANGGSS